MRFDWDPHKDASNREKHGLSFREASALFASDVDPLEIFDDAHSIDEERFISIGPIESGVIVVVWAERAPDTIRIISARAATSREVELFRRYSSPRGK